MTDGGRARRAARWEALRAVLALAWPAALQNLLQSAMFFCDTAIVGRLPVAPGAPQPLAVIQLVGPIVWSVTVITSFFSVGTTALVARAVGERDPAKARKAASVSMRLAALAGVAIAVLGLWGAEPLIGLYCGPNVLPETRHDAARFLQIMAAGFPIHLLGHIQMSALRGAGNTVAPMTAGILANALNVVGNYGLILGRWGLPALGVPGAAVATVAATFVEVCCLFWVMTGRATAFLWGGGAPGRLLAVPFSRAFAWDRNLARTTLQVSLPSLAEAVVSHSAFLAFQRVINEMTESAMAAHRIAITLESVAFLPAFGLYVGAAAYCGQRLGEGRPDLAERGVRAAAGAGAALFLAISALFLAVPERLAGMFIAPPLDSAGAALRRQTLDLAAVALRIGAIEVPLIAAAMALYGGLRGAGETRGPLWVAFVGGWLLRVPLAVLLGLSAGWGLAGVWTGTVVDWGARLTIYRRLFRKGAWKQVSL